MAKFTAILEQAEDGTWSAHTLSPEIVAGTGETREAALGDLRAAMSFWLDYMKDTGQTVRPQTTEIVTFEVAA